MEDFLKSRIPSADEGMEKPPPRRLKYRSPRIAGILTALRHPDDWLFDHRWLMVWVWLVLVLIILFVPAIPYGLQQSSPYVRTTPATVADRATLLLALGTFALANAALLQAVSSERSRRYQMTPGLELWAAVSDASIGTPMNAGDAAVFRPPAGSIVPYVANHGPGAVFRSQVRYAAGITTRTHLSDYARWPLFSERYQDYELREDSVPLAVGAHRPLRVFEDFRATGHTIEFDQTSSEILTQVIVECRCLDPEGHPGKSAYLGLKRSMPAEPSLRSSANASPVCHNYDSWTVMESADVEFVLLNLARTMHWGVPRPWRVGRAPAEKPMPTEHPKG
jgi:hypothetical protein